MTKIVAGVGFLIYGLTIFVSSIGGKAPGWLAPGGAIIVLYGCSILEELTEEDL